MKKFVLGLAMAAVILAGCHKAEASKEDRAASGPSAGGPAPPAPAKDPMEIAITPDLERQLAVGTVKSRIVAASFTVSGRVEADETRQARVGTPVTGRITELRVREGDTVKKGQVLATLSSTELSGAQFAFLKAYSQAQLSKRAAERAQQLLDAGVIGAAELQRRQAELAQNTAEVAAARGQLKILGMPEEDADRLETTNSMNSISHIVASLDGIVLERKATVGQVMQPADTIFVLADLSSVWLVADVPEQTAGNLSDGEYAEAEISSFPGWMLRGRLTHVHSILNPETRTVRVHMDVSNPRRRLKPAMLATMTLREGGRRERVLPATAVVRENNKEFVFAKSGLKRYALREVSLGGEYENMRVLTAGLRPGDEIVLEGAFHLNNERKRLALQGGQ